MSAADGRRGIAVLEIGGTHVSAALVDLLLASVACATRRDLDPAADAETLLETLADAARSLPGALQTAWGIAIPDPFDYERGVALFEGVGKFESLHGVDVRQELAHRADLDPAALHFLNDADAFALGEALDGAGRGHRRVLGLTLGSGVGSGWVVDGRVVSDGPGIPPAGRAHHLRVDGVPLEERMSRRAIAGAYRADTGEETDLRAIFDRSRAGDDVATRVVADALDTLGAALRPAVDRFGADVIAVGGSIAGSWDVVGTALRAWLGDRVVPAALPDTAGLLGAAHWAVSAATG